LTREDAIRRWEDEGGRLEDLTGAVELRAGIWLVFTARRTDVVYDPTPENVAYVESIGAPDHGRGE
jgi:hypothetical protein